MPASMMMAAVGGMAYVAGRRRARAGPAPRPGSTPTAVPRTTPRKQYARLTGERATVSPSQSPSSAPMVAPGYHPTGPPGDGARDPPGKQPVGSERRNQGHAHDHRPALPLQEEKGGQHPARGQEIACRVQSERVGDQAAHHGQRPPLSRPAGPLGLRALRPPPRGFA